MGKARKEPEGKEGGAQRWELGRPHKAGGEEPCMGGGSKETTWVKDTHAGSAWITCSKVVWPQMRKTWIVISEEQTSKHLDLPTSGLRRTVGREASVFHMLPCLSQG